jgi:hypothetical protein
MTEKWDITLTEKNTDLMLVGDIFNHPVYEGVGMYMVEIPDMFYKNYIFDFTAHLDAPHAPNGMKCKIHYHSQIYSRNQTRKTDLSKSNGSTIIVGFFEVFAHGKEVRSTKDEIRSINYPDYKACLAIKFLVPKDINTDEFCYPGDWKLHLNFTFKSIDKIREDAMMEKKKILEEEEIKKMRLKAKIEAEERIKAEAVLKKQDNEFTYDKLLRLKKDELKDMCLKHKLPVSGLKIDIVKRLVDHNGN